VVEKQKTEVQIMAFFRAAIVTPWSSPEEDTREGPHQAWNPTLILEYEVRKFEDITGQAAEVIPPSPNEYTILVECTEEVMSAIAADSDYDVLWSEDIGDN
jgi:hypothetical protein